MSLPAPATRKDHLLAAAAGMDVNLPEPVSKEDKYLAGIAARIDSLIDQFVETKALAEGIPELNLAVLPVDELPETGEANTIYLVRTDTSITGVKFAKYIWIDGDWEALSIAETIMAAMDAWNNQMYWSLYGYLIGKLLIFQGSALKSVTTDIAYAGMTAHLTIINALGESTASVEIGADGKIPIISFSTIRAGFNLIFCETDPTQKDGNKLAGPTAITLTAIYRRIDAEFADIPFSQFLAAHNLRREFTLVEPRPAELDPDRQYFTRFYEENRLNWDALDTTDGFYFVGINSLENAQGKDIYTQEILRISENTP